MVYFYLHHLLLLLQFLVTCYTIRFEIFARQLVYSIGNVTNYSFGFANRIIMASFHNFGKEI